MAELFPKDSAEKAADPMDRVQDWNELHQRVSLHNALIKANEAPPPGFNGSDCADCGGRIEAPRRELNLYRCAECAHFKDREDDARKRNGRSE